MIKIATLVFALLNGYMVGCAVAQRSPNLDPVVNFNTFWQAYQAKYATFDMKHVDWQQQYVKHAPLVDSSTSSERLFTILAEMIKPLNDAHVRLADRSLKPPKYVWPRKPSVYSNLFQFNRDSVQTYWQATNATLSKQGFDSSRIALPFHIKSVT